MSNDVKTATETQTPAPSAPITIENASFSDYERLRRGEKIKSAPEVTSSAPADKAEQKEASASETDETEVKESEESEDHAQESEADEAEETEAETESEKKPTGKKQGGFQRRINKLNARNAELQARLEALEGMLTKTASQSQAQTKKTDSPPAAAEGEPDPDDYETHGAYVKALTKWEAKQVLKERDEALQKSKAETEQANRMKSYLERKAEYMKSHPDFEEAIEGVQASQAIREVIIDSEYGPALAHELAKNPDEIERINKMGPLAAARELGKIEARLAKASSEGTKPQSKKTTQAPKPISPVGTGGKGVVAKTLDDPALSFAEYEKLRRDQLNKRRRA